MLCEKKDTSTDIQTLTIEDIGYIKFYLFYGDNQVNSAIHLVSIYVKEDKRKSGNGKKLLDMLNEYARKNNINYIFVHVSTHNTILQNFLSKNGFKFRQDKILYTKSTRTITSKIHTTINKISRKLVK